MFQMNPTCECNKFSGCAAKGTIDLFNCVDLFVSISLPHFYLADPSVLDTVNGLQPIAKRHETGIYFDLVCDSFIYDWSRKSFFQIFIAF